MTKIVLEIVDESDLDILIPLFQRLHISFSGLPTFKKDNPSEALATAIEIVKKGCNMDSFGDALQYQVESRQDRILPYPTTDYLF
jgi:hypothetical protein